MYYFSHPKKKNLFTAAVSMARARDTIKDMAINLNLRHYIKVKANGIKKRDNMAKGKMSLTLNAHQGLSIACECLLLGYRNRG